MSSHSSHLARRERIAIQLCVGFSLMMFALIMYHNSSSLTPRIPAAFHHQRLLPSDLPHCHGDSRFQYSLLIKLFIEAIDPRSSEGSIRQIVYLPSILELDHPHRYFIDAGARTYESSTGNWFQNVYGMTNLNYPAKEFSVIAFEPDPTFAPEWAGRRNTELLQFAISDKNETTLGGEAYSILDRTDVSPKPRRDRPVTTIDFSAFLQQRLTKEDFLVVKMDVEGAEWLVLPHMMERGTLHLIDELFLDCHAGFLNKTREDCVQLLHSLRTMGIYAHEWH